MRRVGNEPRRGVQPRGPEGVPDLPARARHLLLERGPAGDEQAPTSRSRPRFAAALRALWVLTLVGLALGLAALRTIEGPGLAQQWIAATLGVTVAMGLAVRSGAQVPLFTALAAVVGTGAVLTGWEPLLAGAAVAIGVLTACLAVLATRPAPTWGAVVLEVVIALLVSTAGGLGVEGLAVNVDGERFAYTVLGLAMVSTFALVYRLGGGLHGLGRRGLILGAVALALLVVVLVYTAALTRYGSPDLVQQVRSAQDWTREHLHGVPHAIEVLIGIPALAWGVSLRSRRRQGWWVCAFGVAATAASTSRSLAGGMATAEATMSAVYSVALGLLLGFVVIRLELALTGRAGRDAEAALTGRREPPRLRPLH